MKAIRAIRFYDYGIEDIITGRKHSTLRFGEDGIPEGAVLALCRNSGERVGRVRIVRVSRVRFSDLTALDARIENWSSLRELKARLRFSYPALAPRSILSRYEFVHVPDIPTGRLRGANRDLSRYRPRELVIITSSRAKSARFAAIAKGMPAWFTRVHVSGPPAPESANDPSAESRAAGKAALAANERGGRFILSTDDMGLLAAGGRCYQIPNLGSLPEELARDSNLRGTLTIRTGIAISYKGLANTTVVYRSFHLGPAPRKRSREGQPLNARLFLDARLTRRVADLRADHPDLVEPLKKGLLDCLTGKAP